MNIIIEEKEWFLQFVLLDHKQKELTRSDVFFSHEYIYQFGKEYVEFVLEWAAVVCEALYTNRKIKPNQLLSIVATTYIRKQEDYSWLLEFKDRFSDDMDDDRLYTAYFHTQQFVSSTWYINASSKLHSLIDIYKACGEDIYIDALYYYAFDKIDQHETSDYLLMKRVKAYQEEKDMKHLYEKVFANITNLIKYKSIDTIAVIPNNVARQRSFNEYIYTRLQSDFPDMQYIWFDKNDFSDKQPQKTLRDICKRLENANKLYDIHADEAQLQEIKNILLIDDVVWSGATMNIMSKKIKHIYPDMLITWFSLLWSYRKWFDVVNEV